MFKKSLNRAIKNSQNLDKNSIKNNAKNSAKSFEKKPLKNSSDISQKKNYLKSLLNLLIENELIRVIKIFFKKKILPIFVKFLLAIMVVLLLVYFFSNFFFAEQTSSLLSKAEIKIKHYLHFDFYRIDKIEIIGNQRIGKDEIEKIILSVIDNFNQSENKNLNQKQYLSLTETMVEEIIKNFSWINNVVINRVIPDKIIVRIEEYQPFAIWTDGDKNFVIDKDGNKILIDEISQFSSLLILSGENAYKNVKSLSEILAIDNQVGDQVYSATWLGNRRWDIRLKNATLVKLPEKNITEAWNNLIKIYQLPNSLNNIKSIDLRVEDKIFIIDDSTSDLIEDQPSQEINL